MTLTLFCYGTLTSDDLETTSKQLAGHMLVRNDTLFVIVHHLFQMLCTNPEVYGRWRPFWICVKIGDLPWRDLWGFSTVDRKGTNELISGEKPFIAILSNLKCLFTRLYPCIIETITPFTWLELCNALTMSVRHLKAIIYEISSDTHQLHYIPLYHFTI